jgi:hypothetical protein
MLNKLIVFPIISCILQQYVIAQENPQNFQGGAPLISITNCGKINIEVPLGVVKLNDELSVPLVIKSDDCAGALVPGNTISFLEANVKKVDEQTAIVATPFNENWIFCAKNKSEFAHGDGAWKADVIGDKFLAYCHNGLKMEFSKGSISSLTRNGTVLASWFYQGGCLKKISGSAGFGQISLSENGNSLSINCGNESTEISWEYLDIEGGGRYPVLKEVSMTNGRKFVFENKNVGNVVSTLVKSREGIEYGGCSYDALTRTARSINGVDIGVKAVPGFDIPKISWLDHGREIIIRNPRGTFKGMERELLPNGEVLSEIRFVTPLGPRIRKIVNESKRAGGNIYSAFYDAGGTLLKDSAGEYERSFENGQFVVRKNGIIMRRY